MKHALIIGGTGMLAGVTIWLNETGYFTTVLARNQEGFSQLVKQLPSRHQFISLDYKNTGDLKNKLWDTINNNGKNRSRYRLDSFRCTRGNTDHFICNCPKSKRKLSIFSY